MKLNYLEIPTPKQNIAIEYNEISTSKRTVSGLMVKDIVGIKRVFGLKYSGLKPDEALIFIDIYKAGKPVEFEFEDVSGKEMARVYITALPREIFIYEPRYTKDINITLEEE
jgi:hypothetical protein